MTDSKLARLQRQLVDEYERAHLAGIRAGAGHVAHPPTTAPTTWTIDELEEKGAGAGPGAAEHARQLGLLGGPAGRRPGESLVGAVKVDPGSAYSDVPRLLQAFIQSQEADAAIWGSIKARIDYVYGHLEHALVPVLVGPASPPHQPSLHQQIRSEIRQGKRLFFKLNLIDPTVLAVQPPGVDVGAPGPGDKAASDWTMVAALMRFFHDRAGVKYHQMAFGDGGTFTSVYSQLLSTFLSTPCSPEAILEGRIEKAGVVLGYGGFPGYFVRKYLRESCGPAALASDDPMNGYQESMGGTFVSPGRASDKLMAYDLNNVGPAPQDPHGRGRTLRVDHASNYGHGIVAHKALVGDPHDLRNYPGSVLVNVCKLKIHCWEVLTNAVKNIGLGVWPMLSSGHDGCAPGQDWLYAGPCGESPPAIKACGKSGVYHSVHYSKNTDVDCPPQDQPLPVSKGLDGTVADMCLAVRQAVPVQLHFSDAIQTINRSHTGDGAKVDEGLVFASTDPVALDLLCARYLFKTVPMEESSGVGRGLGKGFAVHDAVPYYDRTSNKILSRMEQDSPVSRETIFTFCREKGLGGTDYRVMGRDITNGRELTSQNGHLGVLNQGRFEEVFTTTRYFHQWGAWWGLQKVALAYLDATDQMTGTHYLRDFMAEMDGSGLNPVKDGVLDYSELGFNGTVDSALGTWSRAYHRISENQQSRGMFIFYQRMLKWSEASWNEQGFSSLRPFKDSMAIVNGIASMNADTGEWQDFTHAVRTWNETLVVGMSHFAETAGRPFQLFVPEDYALDPGEVVKGLVVIPESDPEFAKKVFTVQFTDTQEVW